MSKEAQRIYLTQTMTDALGDFPFPISIPNQPFNIPKNAVYGEFHILEGPKPVVISGHGRGKVLVRYVGFVQLTVWIPKGKGIKDGTTGEDTFKDLWAFRQARDSAMSNYKFGAIQGFTPQTKEGYEVVVFRVPFHRDTRETVHIGI